MNIPEGYKLVPIDATEEMIQAGCINQCTQQYANYEEWWDSHSGGVSERIRTWLANDYKAMVLAYKDTK